MNWNQRAPDVLVSKAAYPNAPDASLGKPLAFLIGDHRGPAMRIPWANAYGADQQRHDLVGGGGLWVPGIVVDRGGLGQNSVKVLLAAHKCKDDFDAANVGELMWLMNAPHGSILEPSYTAKVNSATEAGYTINDDVAITYAPIIPVDVRYAGTSHNSALNPRNAFDTNESSYAFLDHSGSATILDLYLPNVSPLGDMFSAPNTAYGITYVCAYRTEVPNGITDSGLDFGVYDATASTWNVIATLAASATATTVQGAYPLGFMRGDGSWNFSEGSGAGGLSALGNKLSLQVRTNGGAGQKARIYFVGIFLNYRPNQDLLLAQRVFNGSGAPAPGVFGGPFVSGSIGRWLSGATTLVPPPDDFRSIFAGNLQGRIDDTSDGFSNGDFTGTSGAVIERTADVIRWILCKYGGLSPTSDFETGSTAFGSFVAARSYQPVLGYDFVHSLWGGDVRRVSDWLRVVAGDGLATVWLDRFDNKWRIKRWVDSETVDYDLTFKAEHLASFEVDETSDTEIENAIRVKYGYQPATKEYLYDTFINPNGSDDGPPSGGSSQSLIVNSFTVASCTVTNLSKVVTGSGFQTGATALQPGMGVFGTNVPANAVIVTVDSNTRFTMNKNATGTPGAQTLTFTTNGTVIFGNSPHSWSVYLAGSILDWYFGSVAAGTYSTPASLALAFAQKMGLDYNGSSADRAWKFGWSFLIDGECDKFYWKLTGSTGGLYTLHSFSVPHADYRSGDALAAAVTTAWNTDLGAAGVGSVTYDSATGLFTCALSGTSAPTTGFTLSLTSSYTDMIFAALGYQRGGDQTDTSAPFSITGTHPRGDQLFYIDFSGLAGDIGWITTPTNAGGLLGSTDVADANAVGGWTAGAKRGTHVTDAGGSGTTYGEKGEMVYYAESLRDWRSAVDLRDRRLVFKQATRKIVRFSSRMCPDMQRGRIVQFDADVSTFQSYSKYASDGSWAGKKFRVIDVTQQLAGEWWTQATAVEVN